MKFEKISYAQFLSDLDDRVYDYDSDIKMPKRATKGSAGYDIYSVYDFELGPGETILLPTGIKFKCDRDKYLFVVPRSGQGFKYKVQLYNTCGIIDSDYYNNEKNEGHMWVKLYNDSPEGKTLVVNKGDAVCQGIISPYFVVEDDESNDGRVGGFGSTTKLSTNKHEKNPTTLGWWFETTMGGDFDRFISCTDGIIYSVNTYNQLHILSITNNGDLTKYYDWEIVDTHDMCPIIKEKV